MAVATTIQFSDIELYERLRREAFQRKDSMSRIIAYALYAYFEQLDQEAKTRD